MRGDPQKGSYMYISDLIIQLQVISKHDEKEHSSIFLKKERTGLSNSKQQSLAGSFNKIDIYGTDDPPQYVTQHTHSLHHFLAMDGGG
jgi:hypothetical protein